MARTPLGLTLQGAMMADPGNLSAGFAPPAPHGFFREGGMGRTLAGTIGDFLLQQAHMQPVYAPAMRDKQVMDHQEVQWQRQRQANNEDWQQRQQWELQHKPPTAFEDNAGNRWVTDPVTGENRMVFVDKAPKQYIQDGQLVTVPNPFAQGAAPQTITEDLWNSGTPVGGATMAGTPPFGVSRDRLDNITMMAESGGNPNAVSPAGALGRMQVMPATARDPGFGIRPSNGTPEDHERVGREYRAAMQKRYGGDPAKMWAAYNAGPGRVDKALGSGPEWLRHMPIETQNYVARNLRALRSR